MSSLADWDRQIHLFARYFLAHANLPRAPFTLLDVGCGTGAALWEIKRNWPEARLWGCDICEEHVGIARGMYGNHAEFFRAAAREVEDSYDVLYVSNLLEHLVDWGAVLDKLLGSCRRAYLLVPYREECPPPSDEVPGVNHLASFDRSSFAFIRENRAAVETRVISTPHAWGHPPAREAALRARAFFQRRPFAPQRELLVAITTREGQREARLPRRPFVSRAVGAARSLRVMACA